MTADTGSEDGKKTHVDRTPDLRSGPGSRRLDRETGSPATVAEHRHRGLRCVPPGLVVAVRWRDPATRVPELERNVSVVDLRRRMRERPLSELFVHVDGLPSTSGEFRISARLENEPFPGGTVPRRESEVPVGEPLTRLSFERGPERRSFLSGLHCVDPPLLSTSTNGPDDGVDEDPDHTFPDVGRESVVLVHVDRRKRRQPRIDQ